MNNFTVDREGVFNPRPYQIEGLNKIAEFLRKGFMSGKMQAGFVEYSVGYGKTSIYAFLARHVTKNNFARKKQGRKPFRVLVIAHISELTKQNSDFAWKSGVPNTIVASDYNKGKNVKNMELLDVVFANEKTLANRLEDPESKMFDDWIPDLIAIDEGHMLNWKNFIKFERGDNSDDCKETCYTKILRYFLAKNPKIQILGGSGSPWRNNEWIKGTFWTECIDKKDTADLIQEGFLTPIQWGSTSSEGYDYTDLEYTLDETGDREVDLDKAQKITSGQLTVTEQICQEVVSVSESRNAVLIFCSGQDHLKEVKAALVACGVDSKEIGLITESTSFRDRTDILDRAREGKCKYVLNVSVLTTGVNVPLWDTCVFMRPIGSVVLFTQAVGRVIRLHDDEVKALGYKDKENALILDYAGVYDRLGHLADELSNEETHYEHSEKQEKFKCCPQCGWEELSYYSAICQCGYDFGEQKPCNGFGRVRGCGHMNKSTARRCSECHTPLSDVNEKLSNKHYRKHEFSEVQSMGFSKPIEA